MVITDDNFTSIFLTNRLLTSSLPRAINPFSQSYHNQYHSEYLALRKDIRCLLRDLNATIIAPRMIRRRLSKEADLGLGGWL